MTTTTPKRLFLLRHALAMSPMAGGQDITRILSPKGLEDAAALGKVMMRKNYVPDFILCSTATRTRQTLEKLLETLPRVDIQFVSDLYNCGTDAYGNEVQKISGKYSSVLVLGHNPCIYEYAVSLAGSGRDALLQRLTEGYKPATLSVLSTDVADWALIENGKAEITDLLDPLDYNAPDRPTRWT